MISCSCWARVNIWQQAKILSQRKKYCHYKENSTNHATILFQVRSTGCSRNILMDECSVYAQHTQVHLWPNECVSPHRTVESHRAHFTLSVSVCLWLVWAILKLAVAVEAETANRALVFSVLHMWMRHSSSLDHVSGVQRNPIRIKPVWGTALL